MKSSVRRTPPLPVFLAATIVIFMTALSAADSVGFVPDYIDGAAPLTTSGTIPTTPLAVASSSDTLALSALPQLGESATTTAILPKRIVISAIGMDLPVQNPSTRDVDTLDNLLQQGPARYVDSATLGEPGNLLIFAHSSHLPIVHNQMFKAFNKIPNLTAGDLITITGDDGKNYLYSVDSVKKANADEATIDLSPTNGTKLTLVTCDTLTSKSARFILTATYIGVQK